MSPGAGPAACGWFGKIACLGDFSSRRLPQAFVEHCDTWLSGGLAASRAQLGERWLDTYLSAPLWRFAWGPGLAGPLWWLGVLMPSVDRVGRYFPLIAARSAATLPATPQALAALQAWFDHVADALLGTLQPDGTLAAFDARLVSAPGWETATATEPLTRLRSCAQRERYESPCALDLPAWHQDAGHLQLRRRLQGHSLWLAGGTGGTPSTLSIAAGLPAAEQFVELLRGSW